jgi:hypothetical protein
MSACLFTVGVVFLLIGVLTLIKKPGQTRTTSAPIFPRTYPQQTRQTFPTVRTTTPGAVPVSIPTNQTGGVSMNADKLNWINLNDRIKVKHPQKGEMTVYVSAKITYDELWQRGPQAPWTSTGNTCSAFWLEGNMILMNWLNRFYLLEEFIPVTDVDIQRDFAPFAKQFAQSNQTGDIYFSYPPAMWHIDDIGKFTIARIDGSGFHTQIGAIGRFIHASGDSQRALVLEDYEGGSGQDMVNIGYVLEETDIQK